MSQATIEPLNSLQVKSTALPQVTLVIGAGGVKCAAALGVVSALSDAGINIERIVGCSTGAVFASLIALGYPLAKSKAITARLWSRQLAKPRKWHALTGWLAFRPFSFVSADFGVRDDRNLSMSLTQVFGDKFIEDTALPLALTATDFTTGEQVVKVAGSLTENILASLSLPPAYPPKRIDGRFLADGALTDPLPVSVAIKHGARIIVAVGFESPYQKQITGNKRIAGQLSAIHSNNLLRAKLAFNSLAHHAEMIVIMPEFRHRAGLYDTDRLAYIINEGEQAALEQLPYLHHLLQKNYAPQQVALNLA